MNRRFALDRFVSWAEDQIENGTDPNARFVARSMEIDNGNKIWKVWLRVAARNTPEEIVFIRGDEVDTLRFNCGDETRQFHSHKRDVSFSERTLKVQTDGITICEAGTTSTGRRGSFPV